MNTILTLLHSESSKLYAILAFLSAIGLSSIFMSGKATSENTTLVFMREIQIELARKKSNFLFLLCIKIAII